MGCLWPTGADGMLIRTEAGAGQWSAIRIVRFRISQVDYWPFDSLNWEGGNKEIYNTPIASAYKIPPEVKHTWDESSIKAERTGAVRPTERNKEIDEGGILAQGFRTWSRKAGEQQLYCAHWQRRDGTETQGTWHQKEISVWETYVAWNEDWRNFRKGKRRYLSDHTNHSAHAPSSKRSLGHSESQITGWLIWKCFASLER